MSVPFCFGQQPQLSLRAGQSNLTILPTISLHYRNFSATSFFSPLVMGRYSGSLFNDVNGFSAFDTLKSDTTAGKPVFKKFKMKRSPWLAVGLSALLPGAGQFYNGSYWKVPILLALTGYFGYEYYDNDKKYRDFRDRYAASQTFENQYIGDENLKAEREFYRNQRNDFVWYFAIVYVVNLIDAYVDAHLFDFNVKEDKFTRFGISEREYKLNVRVRF